MARTDVCFIAEGSYPYVVGGVSTWVHDIISSLKDISFSLVFIGVSKEAQGKIRYELPKNVLEYKEIHLMQPPSFFQRRFSRRKAAFQELEAFIEDLARGDISRAEVMMERFSPGSKDALSPYDIFYGRDFWDILLRTYEKHFDGFSFIDYFWTVRFMMMPLFALLHGDLPEAALYHATCTGYAGLLGVIARLRNNAGFILTEHGIYTNERMIEITQAQWIYREQTDTVVPRRQLGQIQNLWMKKFDLLSRLAYKYADAIFTLYEGNRQMQIQGGAPPEKCEIIPNGIEVDAYEQLYLKRLAASKKAPVVALVGRVTPIKDVKTFIKACKMVQSEIPGARFFILGNKEEDEKYVEECERLIRVLDLQKHVIMTGSVNMREYYPFIDCVVLTSISEAQPFVVLEAMATGIPVVATNVGACMELLEGASAEDQALGRAGLITNIRSPRETADAIIKVLKDQDMARRMGEAGRLRVKRYYQRSRMLGAYEAVYRRFAGVKSKIGEQREIIAEEAG